MRTLAWSAAVMVACGGGATEPPPQGDSDDAPAVDTDGADTDAADTDNVDTDPADTDVTAGAVVSLSLTLVDGDSGAPLVGALVTGPDGAHTTDVAGLAVLVVPANARATARVEATGYPAGTVSVAVAGVDTSETVARTPDTTHAALLEGVRVDEHLGRVRVDVVRPTVDGPVPYDGVTVSLGARVGTPLVRDPTYHRGLAVTGEAYRPGEATVWFYGVPDGDHVVTVEPPAPGVTCGAATVSVAAGEEASVRVVCDATEGVERYDIANRWYHAPLTDVPAAPAQRQIVQGRQLPNLRMRDQHGDDVDLYQFAGRYVYFDIGGVWCEICVDEAPMPDDLRERFAGAPFEVVQVVLEDSGGGAVRSVGILESWAHTFDVDLPVLLIQQADFNLVSAFTGGSLPDKLLIGPDMRVIEDDFYHQYDAAGFYALGEGNVPEDCGDGADNDHDWTTDCVDPDCDADPGCGLAVEIDQSIRPCDAIANAGGGDAWDIDVRGRVARVEIDTRNAERAFDTKVRGPLRWRDSDEFESFYGDEEMTCAYAPANGTGCAVGHLAIGRRNVLVTAGGASQAGGGCRDEDSGDYTLRIFGDATATLAIDDLNARLVIP